MCCKFLSNHFYLIVIETGHKNPIKMETKEELRKRLTPLQYQVTQEAGTERAFTG